MTFLESVQTAIKAFFYLSLIPLVCLVHFLLYTLIEEVIKKSPVLGIILLLVFIIFSCSLMIWVGSNLEGVW